jgi:hypothetical protein
VDRVIATGLVLLLLAASVTATAEQNPVTAEAQSVQSQTENRSDATPDNRALPDSPGASAQAQQAQPPTPPPAASSPQQGPAQRTEPIGTAAAGIENTAGIAASKPAGVALAPPKQRRVRVLVIKLGAIAAAGAALGTVLALSKASPSKPPGAH